MRWQFWPDFSWISVKHSSKALSELLSSEILWSSSIFCWKFQKIRQKLCPSPKNFPAAMKFQGFINHFLQSLGGYIIINLRPSAPQKRSEQTKHEILNVHNQKNTIESLLLVTASETGVIFQKTYYIYANTHQQFHGMLFQDFSEQKEAAKIRIFLFLFLCIKMEAPKPYQG